MTARGCGWFNAGFAVNCRVIFPTLPAMRRPLPPGFALALPDVRRSNDHPAKIHACRTVSMDALRLSVVMAGRAKDDRIRKSAEPVVNPLELADLRASVLLLRNAFRSPEGQEWRD